MSRSPNQVEAPLETVQSYRQGWSALSELIGQGRSFSGKERNCCFLNVEGQRFANVAASTGLDLIDDSRALAVCDWDFDGQLDFWLTNRTAPRVRFLHNVSSKATDASFVGFRLEGTQSNRDAIGARVEVTLADGQKLLRTLHAGDGFLAQSSKWLHFGIGESKAIREVMAQWPGGNAEVFNSVTVNTYHLLKQGTGKAERVVPETPNLPTASTPPPQSASDANTRTWLIGRVPMPAVDDSIAKSGKPQLVNLWSSTCQPCLVEMHEWTQAAPDLQRAGLEILAMNVDGLSGSDHKMPKDFPFATGEASAALVNAMEITHRTFIELQQPLPVPTSFLLDSKGRVAAFYKGKVSVETLLKDVALLSKPLEEQRAQAVPYSGRWASKPFVPNPNRIASNFSKAGQDEEAIAYLKRFLAGARVYLEDQPGNQQQHLQVVISSHDLLGDLLMKNDQAPQAARVYANLTQLAPNDTALHKRIGERLLHSNVSKAAHTHLEIVVRAHPKDTNSLFNAGLAALGSSNTPKAITYLQRLITLRPNDVGAHYQLARALQLAGKIGDAKRLVDKALRLPLTSEAAALRAPLEDLNRALDQQ